MATPGQDRSSEPVVHTPGADPVQRRTLPKPGDRVGQYELIRELGRGGMGAVYLARDTKLGRRVAIKFLQSSNPEITARFILEARATARCNHENIIVIHEVGEHHGNPFMVLEYLQGAELTKQIKEGRKMPATRAVELMVPVVRALVRAHEHNIVHRDLKPDNIFITDTGSVKVLDFGIAKLVHNQLDDGDFGPSLTPAEIAAKVAKAQRAHALAGPDDRTRAEGVTTREDSNASVETKQGALVGTLPFMSPEQWGAGKVDHRTDIWAVGIILFKMVAGKHPLAPRRGYELMIAAKLDEPMPSVRQAAPDIPDELADVIDRCLIKPKEQRIGSAQELLDKLEPLLPGRYTHKLRIDQSPYAGLSAFQESDASRFFGRTREIAAAASRLRDTPLLGVVGPSGVGKSSFVRAGILPALKQSGEAWTAKVVRPGREPLAALARVVAPMLTSSSSSSVAGDLSEQQAIIQRLYNEPGYLGTLLRSRARRRGENILIFVDQFEELYTLCGNINERRAFTACLASAADDATTPLRVVISIRSDFLDRVPEDQYFMSELTRGLFFLTPPNRDGLRDALVQPAEMAGFQFESPTMVEDMLDHLEHVPGALPLLQFAASKMWDTRDSEQHLFTEESYQALGGIAGALASHADSVLAEFPTIYQNLVRTIFLRLVTPDRTRAYVSMNELYELSGNPSDIQRVVDQLVRARLLVVQTGDAGTGATVEIVHESLIHSWPMLRRWLDETQDDAAFLEQLRIASKNWQAKGYPNGLLWRGEAMEEAQRFSRRYRGELPELQQAYLNAVFNLAARSGRRKRIAVFAIIGILSLMVAAAAVALVLIRNAERKASDRAELIASQLERIQAEQSRREKAESKAQVAEKVAEKATIEVDETKEELRQRNAELEASLARVEEARKKAERAKRKARKAKQNAEDNEEAAKRAEEEARRANEELQVLLAKEKARADRLAKQGTLLIEDVAVKGQSSDTTDTKKKPRKKKRRKRSKKRSEK